MTQQAKSEVEWISELPSHWRALPLRGLAVAGRASFIDGDWIEAPYITEDGVRLLQTGNVGTGQFREQGFRYVSERTFDDLRCTEVSPGDVLICRLAEPVGRACLAPHLGVRMITSVDVCIMKPSSDNDRRFIVYLLSSPNYLSYMEGQCRGGTRDRVSRSFLGAVRVPVPPLLEQTAISAFLDRETSKIDALVEQQERLIELLKEKRQTVISYAVTKGLNSNVPMKDTGVEWLGNVPDHWQVGPLRRFVTGVQTGRTPTTETPAVEIEGGVPWYTPGDFNGQLLLDIAAKAVSKESIENGEASFFPEGSVLVVSIGATLGKVGLAVARSSANQQINAVIPSKFVDSQFLAFSLASKADAMRYLSNASTIGIMNQEKTKEIPMVLPPLEEQVEICHYLTRKTTEFDTLISKAADAVSLLQERRAALISAAVTGKIDVRQYANVETAA
ncbi:restriction endonuclease subunit S [Mesorhizobium sp. M7D.F.Ca.US.005.01.1.1]|uniref:restriction endonuclease subunit S n=1 Tax=Mesorhizobium sp. M7D.F.Ca.US.005.01.1.1 TaxID=2493678 RepID=UPI0032B108CA